MVSPSQRSNGNESEKHFSASGSTSRGLIALFCFLWGVVFVVAGYTKYADNFCLEYDATVNKVGPYVDHDKLLGPDGSIVDWCRQTGIILILGTVLVFGVCEALDLLEKRDQEQQGPEGDVDHSKMPKVAMINVFFTGVFILTMLVQSGRILAITFGKGVPLECKHGHMGDNFVWETVWVFSVISLIIMSCVGLFLILLFILASFFFKYAFANHRKG
jgi:magnesium-transporting ATPase (P-type)